MTWIELQNRIGRMTADEINQSVRFKEPYDDDAEIYEVSLVRATENLLAGDPADMPIKQGEFFLA